MGFSGPVLKWVLLVWMEMSFSSYWVGMGWAFTRCGLGVGWGWVTRESSLPVSQPRRRLRPRPPSATVPPPPADCARRRLSSPSPLQGRKVLAALLAGHPCKAAGRRPPSLLAVELPSGAGPPAALLAGRPHHPPYPPARPAPQRQVIDLLFAPSTPLRPSPISSRASHYRSSASSSVKQELPLMCSPQIRAHALERNS